MIRRRTDRAGRLPRWETARAIPMPEPASEPRRWNPLWAIPVLFALAATWYVGASSSDSVAIHRSDRTGEAIAVEVPPAAPPSVPPDPMETPVAKESPREEASPVASAPSVGLVDAGSAGGSGNAPGLDLGLEGRGEGMAVAAGGGGKGHGVGSGTGNGVGTQRMVYQMGQVDQDVRATYQPEIPYPRRAKEDGVQAEIELRLLVDEHGRVESVEVLGAPPGYGFEAAIQAGARSMRFQPAQLGGVPVPQWVRMPYSFHLEGK